MPRTWVPSSSPTRSARVSPNAPGTGSAPYVGHAMAIGAIATVALLGVEGTADGRGCSAERVDSCQPPIPIATTATATIEITGQRRLRAGGVGGTTLTMAG